MQQRFNIKNEVKELWKQEEMYWGTRAKINWLKWGDTNSKYFHASTVQRRTTNVIHRIKDKTGRWLDDNDDIMAAFKETFDELYRGEPGEEDDYAIQHIPSLITQQDNSALIQEIHEEEVRRAVFSLGATKAPGPDGFTGVFFQKTWITVSRDIMRLVRDFFHDGTLPSNINETHITLVPKIPNPEEISHYRPISCCNFIMKVITRIMALRMKPLMEKVIATKQSAFVEGRQIQDNLVIVHEAFHTLKMETKKTEPYMAI